MLTLAECKKIIGEDIESLTDDNILAMRNALYGLAELVLDKKSSENNNFVSPEGFGQKDTGVSPSKSIKSAGTRHERERQKIQD